MTSHLAVGIIERPQFAKVVQGLSDQAHEHDPTMMTDITKTTDHTLAEEVAVIPPTLLLGKAETMMIDVVSGI